MTEKTVCGIDLGSRQVKIALMAKLPDGDGWAIKRLQSMDTMRFYREYGRKRGKALEVDFAALGMEIAKRPGAAEGSAVAEEAGAAKGCSEPYGMARATGLLPVDRLVSTGYGRNTLELAGGKVISELQAHVGGAVYQTGLQDFTLVDLGGQDSKIVQVRGGKMIDFATNDKCAASSGRYLENMAVILDLSTEELGQYADAPAELNSTCAVFGESELIGKIAEGVPVAELAAGVNASIVKRILPLLRPFAGEHLVFTGGVARNQAVRTLLASASGKKVIVPAEPQYNGAIGCCLEAEATAGGEPW